MYPTRLTVMNYHFYQNRKDEAENGTANSADETEQHTQVRHNLSDDKCAKGQKRSKYEFSPGAISMSEAPRFSDYHKYDLNGNIELQRVAEQHSERNHYLDDL